MSKATEPETKPLTEAELVYFRALNDAASVAYQRHLEEQRRLSACLFFLREQHGAPEGEWGLQDLSVGFERTPKPKRKEQERDGDKH